MVNEFFLFLFPNVYFFTLFRFHILHRFTALLHHSSISAAINIRLFVISYPSLIHLPFFPFFSGVCESEIFSPILANQVRGREKMGPDTSSLAGEWPFSATSCIFIFSKNRAELASVAPEDQLTKISQTDYQDGHSSDLPHRRGGRHALRRAAPGQEEHHPCFRGCQGED